MTTLYLRDKDGQQVPVARALRDCPGGYEAHQAHIEANGECPWCGCYEEE